MPAWAAIKPWRRIVRKNHESDSSSIEFLPPQIISKRPKDTWKTIFGEAERSLYIHLFTALLQREFCGGITTVRWDGSLVPAAARRCRGHSFPTARAAELL
jgi:hypothetical protein